MVSKPLVSILLSSYNGERTLDRCLESIIKQSLTNIEIICCDDCSIDNTYKTLLKWQKRDARIIVLKNNFNMKLSASLNKTLQYAHGEYIARIDDDDYMIYNRLEQEVDFLQQHKEYAIVGSNAFLYDNNGIYGEVKTIVKPQPRDFLWDNCFMHPTTMIRKVAMDSVNGYKIKKTTFSEDYDLWMRMYAKGYRGYNIQQPLTFYYKKRNIHSKYGWKHHLEEAKVRYMGFKKLGLMPRGLLFVLKPLVLGILPSRCVNMLKKIK